MEYAEYFSLKKNLHLRTLSEAIQKNEEKIKKLTNFQKDCEVVLEGLQTLPLELSVNCMIPIGKQALIEGKLKHTNEILVCLGEGYFVKYSAAQAIELTKRRIKRTQDMLICLTSERNLFESRQNWPLSYEAFEDNIKEELVEHWSDQDLENWRVQHRQKERNYHKQKSKEKQLDQSYLTTEEQLFQRLDELELEEELLDEYDRLHINDDVDEEDDDEDDSDDYSSYEDDNVNDNNDDYQEMMEKKEPINSHNDVTEGKGCLKYNQTSNTQDKDKLFNIRKVSFQDTLDEDNCDMEKLDIKAERNSNKTNVTNVEENSNISKINFDYSNVSPQLPEIDEKEINNPAEIHNVCFQPKSILKRSRDNLNSTECNYSLQEHSSDKYFESDITKVSAFENLVTQTVQEKKQEFMETDSLDSVSKKKPISRFKLERINHNK